MTTATDTKAPDAPTDNNTDNTNVLFLTGPGALLASYSKNAGIYRCPADISTCKEFGAQLLRVRSIAMNAFIQGGCSGPSTVSTLNSAWRCYNKQADIQKPAPSELIIHLDEQGDSINDASFCTVVGSSLTVNAPPTIVSQPANSTVNQGQTANFSVAATGGSLTYQWNLTGNPIAGANNTKYTVTDMTAANAGTYTVP